MRLVANTGTETKLSFALRYAALGWHVFPVWNVNDDGSCACGNPEMDEKLHKIGKHPLGLAAPKGQDDATINPDTIKKWWTRFPNANIAAHLASSGLCAIDIDPRNGGLYDIEIVEAKHGPLNSDVLQFTGGGGEHRVFKLPPNQTLPGKLGKSLKGIDVKCNGYIILEPSNHSSGGSYAWEASSDPLQGAIPSSLPDWIRDLTRNASVLMDEARLESLSDAQETELRTALFFIDSDERDTWLNVGMALHSYAGCGLGFDLWNEWSASSSKYSYKDQLRTWNSFKRKSGGLTKLSLFKLAQDAGWINTCAMPELDVDIETLFTQVDDEPVDTEENPFYGYSKTDESLNLDRLPGVLGDIEQYYNDTAKIPQPIFAKQCAFGIVSVLLGRRFKTVFGDFTSLYFLNIASTACGKEHIKHVTEDVLRACKMEHLLAGDGYTSAGAVISTLNNKPAHITVIDEFGMYLEASNNKTNHVARTAIAQLIECFGRLDGLVRSKNYSTMGGLKNADESITIQCPAITIQAMTTPSTFYDNLTINMIRDGLFGRFITYKSDMPRVAPRRLRKVNVPASIIKWSKDINDRVSEQDPVNTFHFNPIITGEIIELDMNAKAERLYNAFSEKMVSLMGDLQSEGIEGTAGRWGELSGRMGMMVELAKNPFSSMILEDSSKSAICYLDKLSSLTVTDIRENLSGSIYQKMKQEILLAIRSDMAGVTERDMHRKTPFSKWKDRELAEVLQSLVKAELVVAKNTREGKPGKPRMAFFALNP